MVVLLSNRLNQGMICNLSLQHFTDDLELIPEMNFIS